MMPWELLLCPGIAQPDGTVVNGPAPSFVVPGISTEVAQAFKLADKPGRLTGEARFQLCTSDDPEGALVEN